MQQHVRPVVFLTQQHDQAPIYVTQKHVALIGSYTLKNDHLTDSLT